jgi:cyclin-dependent kinase 12/13
MDGFTDLEQIGLGAYGQVFRARNAKGELRALKKIRMDGERDGFPVTAARELKLLQQLDHPHVLRVLHIQRYATAIDGDGNSADGQDKRGFCIVFPWYDNDLAGIISFAHKQLGTTVPTPLVRLFLRQLLDGLRYLHANDIVHRDLKPSNLLVGAAGELCIADFGLARQLPFPYTALALANGRELLGEEMQRFHLTNRIATLWYRAPELLLGASHYGPEVDMWSVGCIAAELVRGEALFVSQTGSELSQVDEIVVFAEAHQSPLSLQALLPKYPWAQAFAECRCRHRPAPVPLSGNADLDDLVMRLLNVDPQARLTAAQALGHNFFVAGEAEDPPLQWIHEGRRVNLRGLHDFVVNKKNAVAAPGG